MIDPATLSLILKGVGKAAPAIGQFFGSRAGAEAMKQDPSQIAQQYEELKKNMPQYGVGSGWNEYLAMAKQDPAADAQRQIAAEQEASAIGALKSGGAKALLGGLGASQRQAAQSRMGIEAGAQQRQQQALANYAGQQQRAQDANTLMAQQLAQSQFQAERGAEQYNRQLEAQKKQALGAGLGALAGGVLSGLPDEVGSKTMSDDQIEGYFEGVLQEEADEYGKVQDISLPIDPRQTPRNLQNSLDLQVPRNLQPLLGNLATKNLGSLFFPTTNVGTIGGPVISNDMLNMGIQATGLPGFGLNATALPFFQEEGGMITEGAFSHKTNPIDIMQDGAKVGEMTGGEAILNPKQQKKVAKQSPYFRKLMREFAMRRNND